MEGSWGSAPGFNPTTVVSPFSPALPRTMGLSSACGRKERKEGKSLSAWRKCRHSISALTLLTRRFLNMRSFWTADLNITVLCSASPLHIHKSFSSV
ncbi:unnamed protein product [Leuciscus chuanchicus]